MSLLDVVIKEEEAPDEEQMNTQEYNPLSLKALSSGKCQQIIRVLKDPHEWVEYSELVKKRKRIANQATGQCQGQSDITSIPTIDEVKSEPIWELDSDLIYLQHEPNKQYERNHMQCESISETGQIKRSSIELADQDHLVKFDEIIHINDDIANTDVQTDQKNGYTVEQLNPDETIQEEPPQELVADCRVLLFKHMPPAWHTNRIRQFVIENTSATQEDIIDIFTYRTEKHVKRGQYLFEFKNPEICHLVFKEFTLFSKQNLYTMRAELDIGHQKFNYKLKSIHILPQSRPISKSGQIHQQTNNDTYGLSLSYLESLGIQPPLSSSVLVSHLSMYVDDELVRQIFSIAGQIKFFSFRFISLANITAEIEYDHPVEAVQAVAMFDKQKIYDRVLSVKLMKSNAHVFKLPRGLEAVGRGLGPNGAPLRGVRAMMELQPIKEILQDIKYALRNVQLDTEDNYFDKLVQIRKEVDFVAPTLSTKDYSENTEQQDTHSNSTANTGQQIAPLNIITNTEQQNTLSTSIANIEQQNTPSTSNAVADPSVLLELSNTLKELIKTLQSNNLVNTTVPPNITQESAAQKRPNSNPIESQKEDSQNDNSDPEPAKKPRNILGQQMSDSSSTNSVQRPSTSREAGPSQNYNSDTRYPRYHRNLPHNIFLPSNNVPFIPNGHNVVKFDMIGSFLNSNPFGFNMGQNPRFNVQNVPRHSENQNVTQNGPNMNDAPAHRTNSIANVNQKNSGKPGESSRFNTDKGQNGPETLTSNSPVEITNVNQKPSANQSMNQIFPDPNQNIHKSAQDINPSNVNQVAKQNASKGNRKKDLNAPNVDQSKNTSAMFSGGNTPEANKNANQNSSDVNPNLHQNTSDTNENNLSSHNYEPSGTSTSQISPNILGSDQNPRTVPTASPTPPSPQTTNSSSSTSKSVGDSDDRHRQVDVNKFDTVIFNDLPDGVTAKILNLKMLEVGKVHCVENISKGRFMVKFKYHLDAERCVKLFHHSKVDGKVIEVKYFEF